MANEIHLVFLIHGIRDRAAWREPLAAILETEGCKICPCGYDYFDLFRFWCPGKTRLTPVALVERRIRGYKRREEAKGNVVKMSAIAHSFGTYIMSEILTEATDLSWNRIIFCGSIVSTEFSWDKIASRIDPEMVVNEVGNRDIWPALAKLLSIGYGDAGTHGFGGDVRDRFHNSGHSDYFLGDFPAKYWAPWIHSGEFVPVDPPAEPSQLAGWLGSKGLNLIGFPLVALALASIAALVLALPLALVTRIWLPVYLLAGGSCIGVFLMLSKAINRLAMVAIIIGVTAAARFWLGPSPYHIDPNAFKNVAAVASWDDAGGLGLAIRTIPDEMALQPNRLHVSVEQGDKVSELNSGHPQIAGTTELVKTLRGFNKENPVDVCFQVIDPRGNVIHNQSIRVKIQGTR